MIRRFARPYAKALVDAAGDLEAVTVVREDLDAFARAMQRVPQLESVAANPAIPAEVKARAISKVAEALGLGEAAKRALGLLLENHRLAELSEVLAALDDSIHRQQGVVTAEVTTAEELDAEQREELKRALESLLARRIDHTVKVELEVSVDPTLLGGFVALVGSERYDVSLRGQLDRMTDQLASSAERATVS